MRSLLPFSLARTERTSSCHIPGSVRTSALAPRSTIESIAYPALSPSIRIPGRPWIRRFPKASFPPHSRNMLGAGRILSLSRPSSHAVPTCSTGPRASLGSSFLPRPANDSRASGCFSSVSALMFAAPCPGHRLFSGARSAPRAAGSRQLASVAVIRVTVPPRASPSTANRIKRRGRRPHQRAAWPYRTAPHLRHVGAGLPRPAIGRCELPRGGCTCRLRIRKICAAIVGSPQQPRT